MLKTKVILPPFLPQSFPEATTAPRFLYPHKYSLYHKWQHTIHKASYFVFYFKNHVENGSVLMLTFQWLYFIIQMCRNLFNQSTIDSYLNCFQFFFLFSVTIFNIHNSVYICKCICMIYSQKWVVSKSCAFLIFTEFKLIFIVLLLTICPFFRELSFCVPPFSIVFCCSRFLLICFYDGLLKCNIAALFCRQGYTCDRI